MATQEEIESFFDTYAPYAQAEQLRSGVPASVTLAQAAVESGYGLSGLVEKALNFFGIKASKSWSGDTVYLPTNEYENGKYVSTVAAFRSYDSVLQSFADHSDFLRQNSRYSAAFQTTNPYDFVDAISAAGYATSPSYASTVKNVIKQYDLTKYDLSTATAANTNNQLSGFKLDLPNIGDSLSNGWKSFWNSFTNPGTSLFEGFPKGTTGSKIDEAEKQAEKTTAGAINGAVDKAIDAVKTGGKYVIIFVIILIIIIFVFFLSYKTVTEA